MRRGSPSWSRSAERRGGRAPSRGCAGRCAPSRAGAGGGECELCNIKEFCEAVVSGWVLLRGASCGATRGPGRADPGRAERIRQWEARAGGAARRGGGRGAAAAGGRSPVRSGHDGAQLRTAARPLLRLLGPRGHRRALVRAQGAEPRGDHHDAGHHRRVLLPVLAHRHPGPGQPPVRAAAEERDHLVRALPLGVSSSWELAPQQRPPSNPSPSCSCSSLHPPVPNSSQRCWTEAGPTAQAYLEHCSLNQAQQAASLDESLLIWP